MRQINIAVLWWLKEKNLFASSVGNIPNSSGWYREKNKDIILETNKQKSVAFCLVCFSSTRAYNSYFRLVPPSPLPMQQPQFKLKLSVAAFLTLKTMEFSPKGMWAQDSLLSEIRFVELSVTNQSQQMLLLMYIRGGGGRDNITAHGANRNMALLCASVVLLVGKSNPIWCTGSYHMMYRKLSHGSLVLWSFHHILIQYEMVIADDWPTTLHSSAELANSVDLGLQRS